MFHQEITFHARFSHDRLPCKRSGGTIISKHRQVGIDPVNSPTSPGELAYVHEFVVLHRCSDSRIIR